MRIEVVASIVTLVVVAIAFAVLTLAASYGVPNVVACVEARAPATVVEVESGRVQGQIVEREAFGCTWYFHTSKFAD
jgi:hypothetical protein